jgi:hypothetical protein
MNNRIDGKSSLDETVSNALAHTYGNLSRRSFLSFMTRKLIGLAGVVVASEVLPYLASDAFADAGCGLHGFPCSGGCGGGGVGTSWVQCCPVGTGSMCSYTCCRHTDYCGTQPEGWPEGCTGHAEGIAWCGGSGAYICTVSACSGTFGSVGMCSGACNGPSC